MWYLKHPEKLIHCSQAMLGLCHTSMPLREAGKPCWPFLPNNVPTWTQPEQITSPSHGDTNRGGGDHSELHPAATYLGSPHCGK